ncbi:protein of unknown function [Taphrina deformans PYCC 5710]|uniref:Uncharacterized protein n=1 Tax=Taphrina deformans (strain PYCC 5710 / ATCC 11124 / CBS 356.35 / IMI 108563 / JCM 9778 / NBRC 8474) TaxID=1097556 RepID=R4XJ60_TAPDE|nr:protein of unknown function [Taphrina deformans PYCC 5710]|eukprot:CCG84514.1 protein of unknown function [Taphrina deformans PYCC 5710]
MLSSKLMTMKFMSKSADQNTDNVPKSTQANSISDLHWRLDFRDVGKTALVQDLEVATSYTSFLGDSNGRRNFRKGSAKDVDQKSEDKFSASEDEEAAEDVYARRQSERATDNDNLRSMKGMKSLSGNSPNNKRKNKAPPNIKQKKNKQ